MFRKYWRDPHFWRWLWRDRASPEIKAGICVLVAALILGGGWFAADRLAGASASSSPGQVKFVPELVATTVEKVITVRSNGRTIRKLVPTVVHQTTTSVQTEVVTLPGGVTTVRGERTVDVPVTTERVITTKKVVTAAGRTTTVVTTKLVPATTIETKTSTVIQGRTTTETQTSTVTTTRTVTQPVTVTTTQVVTVTQTTTAPAVTVTVTVPLLTVTL